MLPITVHGRVADIWRSYIVGRLFEDVGLSVTFSKPLVFHSRTAHDYLKDFNAEVPLYQQAGALVDFLRKWEPSRSHQELDARIVALWHVLYQYRIVEAEDVTLVTLFVETLKGANYIFPPVIASVPDPIKTKDNVMTIDDNTWKSLEQFRYAYDRDIIQPGTCGSLDKILYVSKSGSTPELRKRVRAQKKTWVKYAKHVVFCRWRG